VSRSPKFYIRPFDCVLADAITTMSDLPIIELNDGHSLIPIAQRLTRSTELTELIETLAELFRAT
jgi:hypothetical protein